MAKRLSRWWRPMVAMASHGMSPCAMLSAHLKGQPWRRASPSPAVLIYMQHVPAGCDWRSIPPELQTPWLMNITQTSKDLFQRSAWDQPARTLTCEVGRNKRGPAHCHPGELRGLSVEECCAIQTFPPGFCFAGALRQRYRQLGNAVPVKFAQAVAEHLREHAVSGAATDQG
jgi:hypothetical protein